MASCRKVESYQPFYTIELLLIKEICIVKIYEFDDKRNKILR